MNVRLTQKIFLVFVCSFVLLLLPVSLSYGQDVLDATKKGIKKGAEGVKKGAETAADKTEDAAEATGKGIKKGAETVGKGVKDVFDDDDDNHDTDIDHSRMKSSETQSQTGTRTQTQPGAAGSTRTDSRSTHTDDHEGRNLPATAGELPLLALIGTLALAGAGALRAARRAPKIQ
jgi:hypothetical protein